MGSDPSTAIMASLALIIPLGSLFLWWKFRYQIMGPRETIFLGQVHLSETSQVIYNAHRASLRNGGIVALSFISAMGIVMAFIIVVGSWTTHRKGVRALNDGSAMVVEGPIEKFEPYPTSHHRVPKLHEPDNESFVVGGVLFVYSRNVGDGGFSGNPEATTVLAKAHMAKIWYIDNPAFKKKIILKLEVY